MVLDVAKASRSRFVHAVLWLLAAGWLLAFGTLAVHSVIESFQHLGLLDTQVYRMGGQAVLDRSPLYDAVYPWDDLPFTYSPFAALAFVPLAAAGWTGGALTMTGISIAASVRVCQIVVNRLYGRFKLGKVALAVIAACIVVALWPVRSTLEYGQINILIMWLVVEDLLGRGSKRRWSGILLGLAIGIKLTPLIFIGMLLWSRQLRRVATATVTAAVTVVVGFIFMPSQAWSYWTDRLFETSRVGPTDFVANQAASGVIARLLGAPNTALWLLAAGVISVLVSWLSARLWLADLRVESVSSVAVGGLLVSPISWSHHWVWMLPAALVLAVPARCERQAIRWIRLCLLTFGVLFGSARIQTFLSAGADRWANPSPSDWIVGSGLVLFGVGYLIFLSIAYSSSASRAPGQGQDGNTPSRPTSEGLAEITDSRLKAIRALAAQK
jgi:alpha-1,2-mannosyltransferase